MTEVDDIIYDETDDYDESSNSEQDVFTYEYMNNFAAKHDAEIKRHKLIDNCISVSVILGIILFTALLVWLKF